jgi:hypothetical protein
MKQETKTVYFCDHCTKYYLTARHINRHEKICGYNAQNHYKCNRCQHQKDTGISKNGFLCAVYQSFVFKPVARHYNANTVKICRELGINEPIYIEHDCEHFEELHDLFVPFDAELVTRFEERFGKISDVTE